MTIPPFADIAEFYAHALAIEREAVRRYREFHSYFAARRDEVLAGLCANLAALESDHLRELTDATGTMTLRTVDPREHGWLAAERDADAERSFYRLVEPLQLLEIALKSECDALGFFEWVAHTSPDEKVRAVALDMAREEMGHVTWVRNAIEYCAPRLP
jgi:rubrerythrin